MSKKANPTLIGGFVLGAIALLVFALAVFGSGKIFSSHPRAVAFFQGNIQGLSVGAPVSVRGVQVGTVTAIQLRLDLKTMAPVIPVYMEIDPSRLRVEGTISAIERLKQTPLKTAIANGLHARLMSQSMVTGQLAVDLDLDPNEPRRLIGADPSTVEIPTSQSDIEKLKATLKELPLNDIAASALTLLQDADKLVTSQDIPKLLKSLAAASDKLDQFIATAHDELPPLFAEIHGTARASRDALTQSQATMTDLRAAIGDLRVALKTADQLLADTNTMVAPNSAQRYDIDQALRNLSATTRSLRVFSEDLQRRPNAMIVGK